jgi:hypothetical protein
MQKASLRIAAEVYLGLPKQLLQIFQFIGRACLMRSLFCAIVILINLKATCQQSPGYLELVRKIQAQEVKFPFPQKDTAIMLGELIATKDKPVINFAIPYYGIRHQHIAGQYEPDLRTRKPGEPDGHFIVGAQNITDTDRAIKAGNYFHVNLQFRVGNWDSDEPTITLGVGSQTKIVHKGDKEVIFNDVLDTDPIVSCYYPAKGVVIEKPKAVENFFLNVLHISWNVAGAGIITLPVLPVKIIYAPVADLMRTNTSSIAITTLLGYSSSISVTNTNNTTSAIPTALQGIDEFLDALHMMGQQIAKDPDPEQHAIGEAISTIASTLKAGLGSQTITRNVSNSQTKMSSYSTTDTKTDEATASCSKGGPGEGDVIAFYTNAQLVWVADKGKINLMLLGHDPELRTPSASQLKKALASLNGKPASTRDAIWHIDAKNIRSLLALDPFTGPNGAFSQPDPARFAIVYKPDGTEAYYQNGALSQTVKISHEVITTDASLTTTAIIDLEVDKPGFLSFLGGPSEDKMVELIYSKSMYSQYTVGKIVTGSFTLNGDGDKDHYHCEVFFDNVFGTFAFRDHSLDLDNSSGVSGVLTDQGNRMLANIKIFLKAGGQTTVTTTDKDGKFSFELPYKLKPGQVLLYTSATNSKKLDYKGTAIRDLKFIRR